MTKPCKSMVFCVVARIKKCSIVSRNNEFKLFNHFIRILGQALISNVPLVSLPIT